jgi:DNA-binding GntR family transcriptional regulator
MVSDLDKLTSIEKISLPDRIAERIRDLIIDGSLPSGTRLREVDLASRLGVSRGALREALRTLQEEGLVEALHNRGRYVSEISKQEFEEIYSLRSILESFAVGILIKNASDEEIKSLQKMVDKTIRAAEAGDYKKANDHDLNWHKQIWKLSRHQRLYHILSGMESQIRVFLTINSHLYADVVDGVIFHKNIMQAIVARDANLAEGLMREHIEEALDTMRKFLQKKE